MPKTHNVKPAAIEDLVMAKVKSNEITMKPRWYFILGSILTIIGVTGLSVGAIFLTNLSLFLLRKHGPMRQWRLELLINSFPWWIPILTVLAIVLGVWILRKYDFSYKKNFLLVVAGFVLSILFAAYLLDVLGINEAWSRRGPMRRFYQQIDNPQSKVPKGRGQGRQQNRFQ